MKTIARIVLAAVIVLGAQSSFAVNPHPSVSIRVLDATSFAFRLHLGDKQKLKIALVDESGKVLFSKSIHQEDYFERKMNLKRLPAGSYSLEIQDEIGTLAYPINLAEAKLTIPVDERIITYNPIIRKTENTVSLVLFSPEKHSHQLSIYNENNELLHGESIEETMSYSKQFDFSKALPGSYSIVINSQGHEYTYLVPVK